MSKMLALPQCSGWYFTFTVHAADSCTAEKDWCGRRLNVSSGWRQIAIDVLLRWWGRSDLFDVDWCCFQMGKLCFGGWWFSWLEIYEFDLKLWHEVSVLISSFQIWIFSYRPRRNSYYNVNIDYFSKRSCRVHTGQESTGIYELSLNFCWELLSNFCWTSNHTGST